MVYWMVSSRSRATSAGGRGREAVIPCWTWLQISLPYLKFLFIQKSLAFKVALGRELRGSCSLLLADLGPGWSRGGKCVPVLPQLEWVTTAQGSTRQDEAWDPPCAHSSGVPAGH